jgi:hypothetical protein
MLKTIALSQASNEIAESIRNAVFALLQKIKTEQQNAKKQQIANKMNLNHSSSKTTMYSKSSKINSFDSSKSTESNLNSPKQPRNTVSSAKGQSMQTLLSPRKVLSSMSISNHADSLNGGDGAGNTPNLTAESAGDIESNVDAANSSTTADKTSAAVISANSATMAAEAKAEAKASASAASAASSSSLSSRWDHDTAKQSESQSQREADEYESLTVQEMRSSVVHRGELLKLVRCSVLWLSRVSYLYVYTHDMKLHYNTLHYITLHHALSHPIPSHQIKATPHH